MYFFHVLVHIASLGKLRSAFLALKWFLPSVNPAMFCESRAIGKRLTATKITNERFGASVSTQVILHGS